MGRSAGAQDAAACATAIRQAFLSFYEGFNGINGRARARFERCDWAGHHADALERLELHGRILSPLLADLARRLSRRVRDRRFWSAVKRSFHETASGERNAELAETFFNSAARHILVPAGVDPDTEFVAEDAERHPVVAEPPVLRYRYAAFAGGTRELLRGILEDYRFAVDYRDLEGDLALAGRQLDEAVAQAFGGAAPQAVETLRPVFFRNKGAYIIGRLEGGGRIFPFVLPLLNSPAGVLVDAVLTDPSEVSIVFSFTRSYFQVETDCPGEIIAFLKSILPLKPPGELYIALGFHKHGKTELYRDLRRQLETSEVRFTTAPGERGMVMLVFALPDHDRVFKVIRDHFRYPKSTTARAVMDRYRLVFERDRVGRLIDAQEFEHLQFSRDRFSEELLAELTAQAARTVVVDGDNVTIKHLYSERKVRPLNLYLREADERAAREAVADYGNAIKELAAANIFPGDFLLKNFGVTRHGRVVFYDYDELCLLTDCNFRRMPPPRSVDQELAAEPWFTVRDNDVFPEEFRTFIDLREPLRDLFERDHADLFTVDFWRGLQERHRAGEILDFYPYPKARRLR